MIRTAIALLSGGLDSMLAIRLVQEQGIAVEALHFQTLFTCCRDDAAQAARELGVRLTVVSAQDDYLDLVRAPRYGYGKGVNPCVDCRIYMFRLARRFMDQLGADFVISGELLGQRPMSQKRMDLAVIARQSDLDDRLVRPLSALQLPVTLPEREGWLDRTRLHGFTGQSRKGLIALARKFGFTTIPHPSSGCALTDPQFSQQVLQLVALEVPPTRWDYELLSLGRQITLADGSKLVLGRNQVDNEGLRRHSARSDCPTGAILLEPANFVGPTALLITQPTNSAPESPPPEALLQEVTQHVAPRVKRLPAEGLRFRVTAPHGAPALPLS
jgi:hypothetical protein